jgi:transposase-like protein
MVTEHFSDETRQRSYNLLLAYFHPRGLHCPHCGAAWAEARRFRVTRTSQIPDYRCKACDRTYNIYSGTVFEGRRLKPEQVMLLVHGFKKGKQTALLAKEARVCRQTVEAIRISWIFLSVRACA